MSGPRHPCGYCGRETRRAGACQTCHRYAQLESPDDLGLPPGDWVLSGATKVWVAATPVTATGEPDPTANAYTNCGTTSAYRRHLREGNPTCRACRDHMSRSRQIERVGTDKRRESQPCGTVAAYARHHYHGELACMECVEAQRIYYRDLMRGRREKEGA